MPALVITAWILNYRKKAFVDDYLPKLANPNAKHDPEEEDKYTFWNDVHPSSKVHRILEKDFYENYLSKKFVFHAPKVKSREELIREFYDAYSKQFESDINGLFTWFRTSRLQVNVMEPDAIKKVLNHALFEDGKRTRDILIKLHWMNDDGKINETIKYVRLAYDELMLEKYKKAHPHPITPAPTQKQG